MTSYILNETANEPYSVVPVTGETEIYFDWEFYSRQTAGVVTCKETAREHYQKTGQFEGLCPHPQFDPVSYKLMCLKTGTVPKDPFDHFQRTHGGNSNSAPPSISELFPLIKVEVAHATNPDKIDYVQHDRCSVEQTRAFANETTIEIEFKEKILSFYAPPAKEFLQKLSSGQGFSFMKYPHGIWTTLRMLHQVVSGLLKESDVKQILKQRELNNAATRLVRQQLPAKSPILTNFVENFLSDIYDCLSQPHQENLWVGISFKGYPTVDNRAFIIPGQNPSNNALVRHMVSLFNDFYNPNERYLDGTVMKRWAISGAFKELPGILKNRQTAIVGPPKFRSTGNRLGLEKYHHIQIPESHSHSIRYTLLGVIRQALMDMLDKSDVAPIMMFQCGGSLAAWLISRLNYEFPQAVLLDFGQALSIWHFDEQHFPYAWIRLYKKAIIENNDLEGYYRDLLENGYDSWIKT